MAKRQMNLNTVRAAILSDKTPPNLKKGLIKKYGAQLNLDSTGRPHGLAPIKPRNFAKRENPGAAYHKAKKLQAYTGMKDAIGPLSKAQMRGAYNAHARSEIDARELGMNPCKSNPVSLKRIQMDIYTHLKIAEDWFSAYKGGRSDALDEAKKIMHFINGLWSSLHDHEIQRDRALFIRYKKIRDKVFSRMESNPGKRWHLESASAARYLRDTTNSPFDKKYWQGQRDAHKHSAKKAANLGMNPRGTGFYYAGIISRTQKKFSPVSVGHILNKENAKKYSSEYEQMVGPFKTMNSLLVWAHENGYRGSLIGSKILDNPWKEEGFSSEDYATMKKKIKEITGFNPKRWAGGFLAQFKTVAAREELEKHFTLKNIGIGYDYNSKTATLLAIPRKKTNPPSRKGAVEIYDDILAIEAVKGGGSLWPKEKFRHDFKSNKGRAKIYGLKDGSILIKGKKKLWKNFRYNEEDI